MPQDQTQSGAASPPAPVEVVGTRPGRARLERLKARQQPLKTQPTRIAKAVEAVASLGVSYDKIDAETWRVIGQHPDLEGF